MINIERIKERINIDTGDIEFSNALYDASFVGWYKEDVANLMEEITILTFERDMAVADITLTSDCRVCKNKSTWCDQNPDKCKGWQWRGVEERNGSK